jgi:membrane protein
MPKQLPRVLSFLRFVLRRFDEDNCTQVAASLTYTTLLALVPFVTIALTVVSAFPVFSDLSVQLKIFILTNLMPEFAGKIITVYMFKFSSNAAQLTAIGIVFLVVTALMMMFTIDRAFNTIWRVSRSRPLMHRFVIYWAMLSLGPLLIGGSLSLTSYLVSLSMGIAIQMPLLDLALLRITPVVLTTLAFALLYLTVPTRYVPRWHALVGGLAASLGFELMKKVFALYITNFASYEVVYGAFASIPVFLMWIYFSWLVVLGGAVIAASLSYWRGDAWLVKWTPGRRFYDALRVLRELYRIHQTGGTLTTRQLRDRIHLGLDELEETLERMSQADWVRKVNGGGWLLAKNTHGIKLGDVYRAFVFEPGNVSSDGELPIVKTLIEKFETSMETPLTDVFAAEQLAA